MTTLAEQIATLESRLAAYESRKVPLSADDACRIWEDDPDDRIGPSCLAVARAALVAAESPAGVEAAFEVWRKNYSGSHSAMLAAIRAAHDAAIDGGCGAARESAGPPWLADAAEALGKKGLALNWSQVISEIRDLRHRLDTAREDVDEVRAERDRWLAEARTNYKDSDNLRRQLDALTRPIDGVEELGRIGFEAWHRVAWPGGDPKQRRSEDSANADNDSAQAIASRVIGALRSAFVRIENDSVDTMSPTAIFDAAVASLKIEPEKVEEPPVDTRPVVKVGQVWQYNGNDIVSVADIRDWKAFDASGKTAFGIADDGRPMARGWRLVTDAPAPPKREPFSVPQLYTSDAGAIVAIRDRIREIERRLEAGGL